MFVSDGVTFRRWGYLIVAVSSKTLEPEEFFSSLLFAHADDFEDVWNSFSLSLFRAEFTQSSSFVGIPSEPRLSANVSS